ncbi:uncharacterized protein FOMMEDRAFT_28956 [Fomitiporia mediterranea MF3/22]|uniref:uncharacterized protein n=1 Tax=Fomitiporia mediterranea (strain MF3/22) TaxID=694068 RepID=UPI00044080AB|nr:uncharacterized protein FOMMEDRAFT_28956 [Fomitiporia mediterranea MF3/22]EJD01790.1 hypothetical protein FOMMEDRAFT_28956 [Fomitiporia mediterranea MF3/22]
MRGALKASVSVPLCTFCDSNAGTNGSRSPSSSQNRSTSCSHCSFPVNFDARNDSRRLNYVSTLEGLKLPGVVRATLSLVGIPVSRIVLPSTPETQRKRLNTGHKQTPVSVRRLLALLVWSLACISINFASGIFVILRAMIASRILNVATRLGLAPSSQQNNQTPKEDVSSPTVLQDRLEIANLAIKQLKTESRLLQEKLKAAGERILKLEANQADYAAFTALQAKYNRVSAEIVRLTKENDELKANGSRLADENAELRQCLAMNEDEQGNEVKRLSMLARLQNQCLESCIFPKDEENADTVEKVERDETSEDSIVIVTGMEAPNDKTTDVAGSFANAPRQPPNDDIKPATVSPTTSDELSWRTRKTEANPIPVFITKRPSLPPKGSKPQLKPLLLGTPPASRRHGTKRGIRKHKPGAIQDYTEAGNMADKKEECANTDAALRNHSLNPCAPVFMPRIITLYSGIASAASENVRMTIDETNAMKSRGKGALSPAVPFICTSPSPNSPFMRPPPARRQSGGTANPSVITTPPTPITSSTPSSATLPNTSTHPAMNANATPNPSVNSNAKAIINASVNTNTVKGTPRSTRASSVKLIRARAALRNSQRVASGSAAIPPCSPAGLKRFAGVIGDRRNAAKAGFGASGVFVSSEVGDAESVSTKRKVQGKARLAGKGVPPRRAFGERTNTEPGLEEAIARWTNIARTAQAEYVLSELKKGEGQFGNGRKDRRNGTERNLCRVSAQKKVWGEKAGGNGVYGDVTAS